jgi:hypothetical protein
MKKEGDDSAKITIFDTILLAEKVFFKGNLEQWKVASKGVY